MAGADAGDGLISLPVEIFLAITNLIDIKDFIRLWRVSKRWNTVFRSETFCLPLLKSVLDDACPNLVADRCTADQLSYHACRLQRFHDGCPYGTTKIDLGEHCPIGDKEHFQPGISYSDDKIAWITLSDGRDPSTYGVTVQSLSDGVILQKRPSTPALLSHVELSSSVVAVRTHSDRLDDERTCFAWDLVSGEEHSIRLPATATGPMSIYGWLVTFFSYPNRSLTVWNCERNTTYTTTLEFPHNLLSVSGATQLQLTGDAFYCTRRTACSFACEFDSKSSSCGEHQVGKVNYYFHCAKFSVTDGTLLLYHKIPIQVSKSVNLAFISNVPSNREGLYHRYTLITRNESSSLLSLELIEDDQPVLLTFCLYDMNSDRSIIQEHHAILSKSFIESMENFAVDCFLWKDTIYIEGNWSMIEVATRAQFGKDERFRVLKHKDIYPDYGGFLFSVNDMRTVGWENSGTNNLTVKWYDQLSYEKAKKHSAT